MIEAFHKVQDAINDVGEIVQDQLTAKGIYALDAQPGIYIKQNIELLEVVSGCEMPNNYNVWKADQNGEIIKDQPLFMCKEKSNCCLRILCRGECRPFKMNLFDYQFCVRGASPDPTQAWAGANKPFKCTILCINRPVMEVSLRNGAQEEYIGKIINPWTCCSLDMKIYDKNNVMQYKLTGSCTQPGWLCREFPCKPCQEMKFKLLDANGDEIGSVLKKSSGCLKACFGDVDDFSIGFPPNTSRENKALLLFCMLLIDYQFFETNPNNNKQGGAPI